MVFENYRITILSVQFPASSQYLQFIFETFSPHGQETKYIRLITFLGQWKSPLTLIWMISKNFQNFSPTGKREIPDFSRVPLISRIAGNLEKRILTWSGLFSFSLSALSLGLEWAGSGGLLDTGAVLVCTECVPGGAGALLEVVPAAGWWRLLLLEDDACLLAEEGRERFCLLRCTVSQPSSSASVTEEAQTI